MPIYTYLCTRGHQFEAWQGINDDSYEICGQRRGTKTHCLADVRRIIVAPGGHVVEPAGIYQPLPDMKIDPKTKRLGEHKITKREYEKQDREHRARMLEISRRGPKLDLEPKPQQRWI